MNPDTETTTTKTSMTSVPICKLAGPPRPGQVRQPTTTMTTCMWLDEEDSMSRNNAQSIPLINSGGDFRPDSSKGWLAHRASPLRNYPSNSSSARPLTSSEDGSPPHDILSHQSRYQQQQYQRPSVPPPPRVSLSLTQSLLPRDGNSRPRDVFSLPDLQHVSKARRKYNDSIWTVIWCSSLTFCLLFSIIILFLTRKPSNPYKINLPYTTFLHTVPLLCILIAVSAAVSYLHIFLLQIFIKPVMIATSFFIPVALFISAIWAFIGSFMWDAGTEPTWGETVGLRLFAIIPLVLALAARRLVDLPRNIHMASSLLTLALRIRKPTTCRFSGRLPAVPYYFPAAASSASTTVFNACPTNTILHLPLLAPQPSTRIFNIPIHSPPSRTRTPHTNHPATRWGRRRLTRSDQWGF